MSTQSEIEKLFHRFCGAHAAVTFAVLVVKTVLPLDMNNGLRIRLECGIAVDVREHGDLRVGAFLQQSAERSSILRPPIHSKGGGAEALELRHVVLGADEAFD